MLTKMTMQRNPGQDKMPEQFAFIKTNGSVSANRTEFVDVINTFEIHLAPKILSSIWTSIFLI